MAGLVIKPRSRILHGHDWVYSSEVLKAFGSPQDGDVVSLKDGQDRLLGSAIFNSKSQIVALAETGVVSNEFIDLQYDEQLDLKTALLRVCDQAEEAVEDRVQHRVGEPRGQRFRIAEALGITGDPGQSAQCTVCHSPMQAVAPV